MSCGKGRRLKTTRKDNDEIKLYYSIEFWKKQNEHSQRVGVWINNDLEILYYLDAIFI